MVSGWSRRPKRKPRQQRNVDVDDDELNNAYFDPKRVGSYGGVDALHRASKLRRPAVERWLASQDAYTLHKPVRRHFKRRRVIVGGRNQQWQADLVDLTRLKTHNDGITFLLTVIDVFSKRAWCVPLKNKSGASLVAAFERLLSGGGETPNALQTDKGSEFLNRPLQTLLKSRGVHHFVTHNEETKASVVERFNRTLKTRMWRYFTKHETLRYVEALPDFVRSYNNAYHRSIGRTPASVDATNQEAVWQRLYGGGDVERRKPKLRVGDRVRISKTRGHFKKGYMANWSEELFTVVEVHPSEPPVYRLKDDAETPIEGAFYEQELQRVVVPKDKLYRVEAVIRRRRRRGGGSEALVKWSGYPASFNSWIDAESLVDL